MRTLKIALSLIMTIYGCDKTTQTQDTGQTISDAGTTDIPLDGISADFIQIDSTQSDGVTTDSTDSSVQDANLQDTTIYDMTIPDGGYPGPWAIKIGNTDPDHAYAIVSDRNSNLYVTGQFQNFAEFGTTTLTSLSVPSIFIAKYTQTGLALWAKAAGENSPEGEISYGIAVDYTGNAYITGFFGTQTNFGTVILTSNNASADIFVAKYAPNGQLLFATAQGGLDTDNANSIAVDSSGNIYVAGSFKSYFSFGTISLTGQGSLLKPDFFVAKFDSAGQPVWANGGSTSLETDIAYGIATDTTGNVYATGQFYETASFTKGNLTSKGFADIFVAKFDSNGNSIWATSAGGEKSDRGNAIAVDLSGNAYVTGWFREKGFFGTLPVIYATASTNPDMFVAKFDGNNGQPVWATSAGGSDYEYAYGLALDSSNNSYVTGWFKSIAYFGTTSLTSKGDWDVFVALFTPQGDHRWALSAGGTDTDRGYGLTIIPGFADHVFVTGDFKYKATFNTTTLSSSAGNEDVFIWRVDTP